MQAASAEEAAAEAAALLERVEKHIYRLDRTLRDTEELLSAVKRGDRESWIRQLQERLAAARPPDDVAEAPKQPDCRS